MKIAPMPLRRACLIVSALVMLCACASLSGGKFAPLFDGRTLNGWVTNGGAIFTVEQGTIAGRTGNRKMGWLCTERHYSDFILELEVNIASGNSGIQVRSHFEPDERGKPHMVGYQIEVDPTPRAWSGGLYDQGRRGWLYAPTNNPAAQAAFKPNQWNKYRIECRGDRIRSWVNGVPVTDYRDTMDAEGLIALQVHNGSNALVRFRNIRIRDNTPRK